MSCSKIGKLLGRPKNTIIANPRRYNCLREAPGRSVEREVADYLEQEGHEVVRQRGDWPFDLLVDGKRVDVKSASLSESRRNYCFSIVTYGVTKNIHKAVDYFLLVFLTNERPVFRLFSSELKAGMLTFAIPETLKTKYDIVRVGQLGDRK